MPRTAALIHFDPGQPGKQTAFTYDGLGRRRTIASMLPGGGSATTTAHLARGDDICQSRDGSNTPIRSILRRGRIRAGHPGRRSTTAFDEKSPQPGDGCSPVQRARQLTAMILTACRCR